MNWKIGLQVEEIVQTVWWRVCTHKLKFTPPSRLHIYLYKLFVQTCKTKLKFTHPSRLHIKEIVHIKLQYRRTIKNRKNPQNLSMKGLYKWQNVVFYTLEILFRASIKWFWEYCTNIRLYNNYSPHDVYRHPIIRS